LTAPYYHIAFTSIDHYASRQFQVQQHETISPAAPLKGLAMHHWLAVFDRETARPPEGLESFKVADKPHAFPGEDESKAEVRYLA
jgi:hypothetical protein